MLNAGNRTAQSIASVPKTIPAILTVPVDLNVFSIRTVRGIRAVLETAASILAQELVGLTRTVESPITFPSAPAKRLSLEILTDLADPFLSPVRTLNN